MKRLFCGLSCLAIFALGCEMSAKPIVGSGEYDYQLRDVDPVLLPVDQGLLVADANPIPFIDAGPPLSTDDGPDGSEIAMGRPQQGDAGPERMGRRPDAGERPMAGNGGNMGPRPDGGPMRMPGNGGDPRPDPGACGECNEGFVCLESVDRCMPDCRLANNRCPQRAPTCNEDTGLCIPEGMGEPGAGRNPPERPDAGIVNEDPAREGLNDEGGCGGCPEGRVCAEMAGRCMPDCRIGNRGCPNDRPDCEEETGLCMPEGRADNQGPPCDQGCGRAGVCDPATDRCVRDCRSIIGRCTPDTPVCNPATGLCQVED